MTIKLPQFTFLCGRLGQGQVSLMKALVAESDQIIRLDLTYPLHEFLNQLFPDSCPAVLDPLENLSHGLLGYPPTDASNHDFPEIGEETIESFLLTAHDSLIQLFGPAALGLLSLRYIRNADLVQNFDHLLFTDATCRADVKLFIDTFGPDECLCIHLGSLNEQFGIEKLNCPHVWLAHPDTKSRISQLQKDLTHDRPSGRATTTTGT